MQKCTYSDCILQAAHPQLSSEGAMWANLCDDHSRKFDTMMIDPNTSVTRLLAEWVKAQGGPKLAARRMSPL